MKATYSGVFLSPSSFDVGWVEFNVPIARPDGNCFCANPLCPRSNPSVGDMAVVVANRVVAIVGDTGAVVVDRGRAVGMPLFGQLGPGPGRVGWKPTNN